MSTVIMWGLVIGSVLGNGTLWGGDGYDLKSLEECKQAWQQHMGDNPSWPRDRWKVYCASTDGQRIDIYP